LRHTVTMPSVRRRVRRLWLAIGLCAFALALVLRLRGRGAGEAALAQSRTTRMRVLTWNVGKIYLGPDHDSRPTDADLAHVAGVIRELAPDVIALQELRDRPQLERLLAMLSGQYAGYVPDNEVNDRRVALLVANRPQLLFSQLVTSTGRAAALVRLVVAERQGTVGSFHSEGFDARLAPPQGGGRVQFAH